jgi:hypothetical protein
MFMHTQDFANKTVPELYMTLFQSYITIIFSMLLIDKSL